MDQPEPQYQSYLLRLWRTGEEEICRAMLEHVDSHKRVAFADLESLCAFLHEQMNCVPQTPLEMTMGEPNKDTS